jgi:enoyl-CoA hydratase/carnithine racemase
MLLVERSDDGAVARLTLAAPEQLNALSDAMLAALQTGLDAIAEDPAVRVVILEARGKAFCAGHDLKEMQAARQAPDGGAAAFRDLFDRCARVMLTLRHLPQPVIASVQGVAVAAGCQLVASCDMAVAAEGVRFGVNGVNIGLFCSTPMVAMTRAVPAKAAFEMLTTGRLIETDEALRLGLINRAVPADQLAEATLELARTVAGKLGPAVRIGKRGFYAQTGMSEAEAYAFAGASMVENLALADTDEGISAFLDRRSPVWSTSRD